MVKRTEREITKVAGVGYLAKFTADDHSLDALDEYRVLPRLKLIQPTTDQALKEAFGEGSVIIRPGDALVCRYSRESKLSFQFVPQFFCVEFAKWADLRDKESGVVVERTFNPQHAIAKNARDPKTRFEVYEGHEDRDQKDQWVYRYVEHLRFAGILYGDTSLAGTTAALSFERGEFAQGRNFISAVKLRRERILDEEEEIIINVPLYAQVWTLRPAFRDRGSRRWFGFDFEPADPAIVPEEEMDLMRSAHQELRMLHDKDRLRVEEDPQDEDTVPESDAF